MEARSKAEALRSAAATGSSFFLAATSCTGVGSATEPRRVGEGGVVDDDAVVAAAAAPAPGKIGASHVCCVVDCHDDGGLLYCCRARSKKQNPKKVE